MSTYGDRNTNNVFKPGGDLGDKEYYTRINATTGEITVRRKQSGFATGDQTVATKLPGKNWDIKTSVTTTEERQWLNTTKNQTQLSRIAEKTSIKAQQELGVSSERARLRTKELLQTGQVTTATAEGSDGALSSVRTDQLRNLPTEAGTRNSAGAFGDPMKYPEDMKIEQDKIKISMIKFNPRSLSNQNTGFTNRDRPDTKDIIGTVTLAIPGGIRDENTVKWGSQDMNAAQARIASAAFNFISEGKSPGSADLAALQKDLTDPLTRTAIGLGFAGAAVGAQGLLARTTGAILNPNTELLFGGPQLRSFTFTFPFSPRSKDESKMVQRIIRFFKQGMAVQRTKNAIFLKAPNVFELKYFNGGADHTFLPKMKTCALLNCSVDYTPDGNYSTYENSSMTKYTMSLTFNELDPIYNDEYDDGKDNSGQQTTDIGF